MLTPYIAEINKRVFLPCTNIEELSKDIPQEIFTPFEFTHANAFYGMDIALKQYAGLPHSYHLKAHYSHASLATEGTGWDSDYNLLPMLFTWSPMHKQTYQKVCKKPMHSIGPIIHYAQNYYTDEQIKAKKERLGRNALFFPVHSSHHISSHFTMKHCLKALEPFKKDFDTIRVSIFWKNFHEGQHKPFIDAGYECVTAGHMFDPLFLPRLKGLLSVTDHTFGNSYGTNIAYGIYMQKPHTHLPSDFMLDYSKAQDNFSHTPYLQKRQEIVDKFLNLFVNYSSEISKQQYAACNHFFGYDHVRTRNELLALISSSEDLFQSMVNKY